ncbi:hypothetical protein D9613_007803 [Agrocybe pediades]|uniref:Uncharacterized protein n=1 Tax=Agrocybe pediades TaxID=84607 RepID=A0A8H4QLU3_9AGAR|nr:hypothetical protein D9613_007803 [Agrocybe pediades]
MLSSACQSCFRGLEDKLLTSCVNPAGQPNAAPLVDLGKIDSATSVTWLANLGPGIAGFLNLRDNTGTVAQSGPFTVQSGSNTTCVGQTPVVTAANGGSVSSGSGNGSSNSGASSSSSASQTASKTAGANPANETKPSGAMLQHAPVGAAAMLSLAFLAMLS